MKSKSEVKAVPRVGKRIPINPELDSVSHINICPKGKTELGIMLSHMHYSPFIHPYFGPFNCMEGFWQYIQSEEHDDALRTLGGWAAQEHGKRLTKRYVDNFPAIIIEANYFKIKQNEKLKKMMVESTLPFDNYYLFGEGQVPIRQTNLKWLVDGFETIRTMLREGKEPEPIDYTHVLNQA